MKNLSLALVGALFTLSLQANGAGRVAQMEIKAADNEFKNVRSVILREIPGPTVSEYLIVIDGNQFELAVSNKVDAGCGSELIDLTQKPDPRVRLADVLTVKLLDHSKRVCEDYQPYTWIADVTLASLLHHRPISKMHLVGNPSNETPGKLLIERHEMKIQGETLGRFADVEALVLDKRLNENKEVLYMAQLTTATGKKEHFLLKPVESKVDGCRVKTEKLVLIPRRYGISSLTAVLKDGSKNRCRHIVHYWELTINYFHPNPALRGSINAVYR